MMKNKIVILLCAVAGMAGAALDYRKLPSPQRAIVHPRIAIWLLPTQSGFGEFVAAIPKLGYEHLIGGPSSVGFCEIPNCPSRSTETWLYVMVDPSLIGPIPSPDNTIVVSAHKPIVVPTNGNYYITFEK